MNTAKINKETEKALNLNFNVELYGGTFLIQNVWFPKSMIKEVSREYEKISFEMVNNWFLDKKIKEYCQKIIGQGYSIRNEIKTYLSPINNVVVDWCYYK